MRVFYAGQNFSRNHNFRFLFFVIGNYMVYFLAHYLSVYSVLKPYAIEEFIQKSLKFCGKQDFTKR